MNKLSQEIVNTILENKDEAFKKLSMESFDVYSFLNKEFNYIWFYDGNINSNLAVNIQTGELITDEDEI